MAYLTLFVLMAFLVPGQPDTLKVDKGIDPSYAELSMQLVEAVRKDEPVENIIEKLAEVKPETLLADLDTESQKKAFWLNVYNAYVQILLQRNPKLFEDRNSWFGYNFFTTPQITIAEKKLSFDDLEHGIMRRSKIKLSLGYLDQWFPDSFVKKFWWDELDPRIHFALNCGAASCPAVAIYDPERVDEQLDIAAKQYLERTTDYREQAEIVEVNRLMSWFRADFGGKAGAIEMLKSYEIIPSSADPEIRFKEYDWTLDLGHYKDG